MSTVEQTDPEALLAKMRQGDRTAAAEFVERFEGRIRRRIRGKLSPAMRRLFDSQEILSTLGRRLDRFIGGGRLNAASMGQLWALLFEMADNSLIEKARLFRSLSAKEGQDSPLAQRVAQQTRQAERRDSAQSSIDMDRVFSALDDRTDREILSLWLTGSNSAEISTEIGIPAGTVRQKWHRMRGRLKDLYKSGAL